MHFKENRGKFDLKNNLKQYKFIHDNDMLNSKMHIII